jgi:hypothetical protein
VAGAGEGPPPSAPSASPAELSDPDADGFDWEALDIRELLESAVASLGWPEGPGLREPAADLAPVWSGREAATAVLMRLLELAVDIAQEASNVRLKLTPAQLGEDEQGPIAGLEIEFRLAQAGSAASERPDDFQGRIEEVAEWLHALGGAMLVPESDTSSLIFSAQLPVAQTG